LEWSNTSLSLVGRGKKCADCLRPGKTPEFVTQRKEEGARMAVDLHLKGKWLSNRCRILLRVGSRVDKKKKRGVEKSHILHRGEKGGRKGKGGQLVVISRRVLSFGEHLK